MSDKIIPGPVSDDRCIREAVCIHTKKIFDSCKSEDIAPLIHAIYLVESSKQCRIRHNFTPYIPVIGQSRGHPPVLLVRFVVQHRNHNSTHTGRCGGAYINRLKENGMSLTTNAVRIRAQIVQLHLAKAQSTTIPATTIASNMIWRKTVLFQPHSSSTHDIYKEIFKKLDIICFFVLYQ